MTSLVKQEVVFHAGESPNTFCEVVDFQNSCLGALGRFVVSFEVGQLAQCRDSAGHIRRIRRAFPWGEKCHLIERILALPGESACPP